MDDENTVKRYSSFTPILILVLSFLFVNVIQIWGTVGQRSDLLKLRSQVSEVLAKAQTINETSEGILRDLVAMAPNSPGAQKIVTDFQVRVNGAQNSAPAPTNGKKP